MFLRFSRVFTAVLAVITLSSCGFATKNKHEKYEASFFGVFDTYSVIIGYAESENKFNAYAGIIHERLKDLHKKYDIYNDYEDVNNIKTINDNAGIKAVEVSQDIIDLLVFAKQAYADTDGVVNIAMGPVLSIWHDYRVAGVANPATAMLPPMDILRKAAELTDINGLIIDEDAGTVYLRDKGMSLDVGALAKGYAAEVATNDAKVAGMDSALVNIGGNICSVGKPLDGTRDRWGVGIQDPDLAPVNTQNTIDTIFLNDAAVVTSGAYQRYYEVDGKIYNHIIDKDTLMPATRYESVSIVCESSVVGEMLSTYLYIIPVEDGKAALKRIGGEAVWIHHDGSLEVTDGYAKISKKFGGYGDAGS